jgi:hypothetical protein
MRHDEVKGSHQEQSLVSGNRTQSFLAVLQEPKLAALDNHDPGHRGHEDKN